MSETDLAVHGLGWAQLLVGLIIFLLPGLALADRMFPARHHLAFAPVLSISAMVVMAVLLNFIAGVPVHPGWTMALALGIAAAAGWPRIQQAGRWVKARAE